MIEAVGLSKRYGETQALEKLDLEVAAGTILGVLGPNGAGKTTGLRILTHADHARQRAGPGGRSRRGRRGSRCGARSG